MDLPSIPLGDMAAIVKDLTAWYTKFFTNGLPQRCYGIADNAPIRYGKSVTINYPSERECAFSSASM